MQPNKLLHILLVEDDEIDAEIVKRVFRRQRVDHPLICVSDGVEAFHALRGENGHTRVPRPYLILLDINLPRMNGIEFLQTLRRDPELKGSIVFVLTTSTRDADKIAAYNEQSAGYFLKASMKDDFAAIIKLLDVYYRRAEFPPEDA